MPKVIIAEKEFLHSEDGNTVTEYEAGEQLVSDRCAEVAIKQLKVAKESKTKPADFIAAQEKQAAEQAE
ncbi:hypothetical protein [Neptunomonas japonica]|uniref:hypothetical protein n=1 Tax=Neptunomonas japonica TaxID=417574 RepID=UPI00041A5E09|nr:hypothetical protein [Neptunomonas japonica]